MYMSVYTNLLKAFFCVLRAFFLRARNTNRFICLFIHTVYTHLLAEFMCVSCPKHNLQHYDITICKLYIYIYTDLASVLLRLVLETELC